MTDAPAPPCPVADLHCDTAMELQAGADLASGNPAGHVDLARLRAGGVALQFFACFVPTVFDAPRAWRETNDLLDALDRACAALPDALVRADGADDVERARAAGKIAAVAAVENGAAIGADLARLEVLRRRGVRYMTLTHARHLAWAASSGEPWDAPHGLTSFGEQVVRAMEDLGILVDVSHVHAATVRDVARLARRPFIASHSCAAALCPLARNLDDEQLRTIAGSGGVVGINFYPGFLDPGYFAAQGDAVAALFAGLEAVERDFADDPPRKMEAFHRLGRETRARQGLPQASLETVVAHVEHVARVAGEDHVAFGSDFDGLPDLPREVGGSEAYPRILARLAERGMGEQALRKLAYGNVLRVLRAAG